MFRPPLHELADLERILDEGARHLEIRVACRVAAEGQNLPVYAAALGNPDPALPAVGFFSGFHGLERIGTQVVLAFLKNLVGRLRWDGMMYRQLESVRLVFMPLVNPGGMVLGTRATPRGVDLMRNAPLNATEKVPFLVGGHRISPRLPCYRGRRDAPMEAENKAVCRIVGEELLGRDFSLAVDCRSCFGLTDRIGFPYAHTTRPIPHLAEIHALAGILDRAHAAHPYTIEPRSRQYLAHGDLWDYLYLHACADPGHVFLPLTLEMGSWSWARKNPGQLLSRQGIFNTFVEHRRQQALRRHLPWLDFVSRAACSHRRWLPAGPEHERHRQAALARWFEERP